MVAVIFAILYSYSAKWKEREARKRAITILCAGDSITAGEYPAFLQEMVNKIEENIYVLNRGVNGHTSGEYMRYMKQTKLVETAEPDFVLLQLGTNDIRIDIDHTSTPQFYKNMEYIVLMFKMHTNRNGSHPIVLLGTIPPIVAEEPGFYNKESMQRAVAEINPAIIKLAKENDCAVVDNYKLFVDNPSLLPGIHPSFEGHKALAENWYKAIRPYIEK